mmetsp:Transcript_143474/g.458716  ORF Transcript_143474/g.458716 Transcript_143474/m.458716 type:complete len:204 (+) Transcript_143474:177-788(+)
MLAAKKTSHASSDSLLLGNCWGRTSAPTAPQARIGPSSRFCRKLRIPRRPVPHAVARDGVTGLPGSWPPMNAVGGTRTASAGSPASSRGTSVEAVTTLSARDPGTRTSDKAGAGAARLIAPSSVTNLLLSRPACAAGTSTDARAVSKPLAFSFALSAASSSASCRKLSSQSLSKFARCEALPPMASTSSSSRGTWRSMLPSSR